MDLDLIEQIFKVIIIPLIGMLITVLVKFVNKKSIELIDKTDNELIEKYIKILSNTITTCVLATKQTYVDSLKKQNKFDIEAQKKAFNMTREAILNMLTEEAKYYLTQVYGDLNIYLNNRIEAEVGLTK